MAVITQKERKVEIYKDVFVKRICDFCGKETNNEYDWGDFIDCDSPGMENNFYTSTTVEYSFGNVWNSDEDFTQVYKIDMCPTCFHKFILANLKNKVEPEDKW